MSINIKKLTLSTKIEIEKKIKIKIKSVLEKIDIKKSI